MIEVISHIIGICPDSLAHYDILELPGFNYIELHSLTMSIKKILPFNINIYE